jgi:hypothetical protein
MLLKEEVIRLKRGQASDKEIHNYMLYSLHSFIDFSITQFVFCKETRAELELDGINKHQKKDILKTLTVLGQRGYDVNFKFKLNVDGTETLEFAFGL